MLYCNDMNLNDKQKSSEKMTELPKPDMSNILSNEKSSIDDISGEENRRRLIVTHKSPDLDAIASFWLLKRFDRRAHADAKLAFVNSGEKLTEEEAEELGFRPSQVTHVDTGLGRFDHHDPIKGSQFTSAAHQVYLYLLTVYPDLENDEALEIMVNFVREIDHFREIYWPEPDSTRYLFMLPEIIRGMDLGLKHDDQHQVEFGAECLDYIYATTKNYVAAKKILAEEGQIFDLPAGGQGIAILTSNDEVIHLAQKQGYQVVIRKDPELGNIRVKARPDSSYDLKAPYEEIVRRDQVGSWFYHPSGKMLLNGSSKNSTHIPSPLTLEEVTSVVQQYLS